MVDSYLVETTTIFNEEIIWHFKSVFQKVLSSNVNHARVRSWNQPVLKNDGKGSCSWKQLKPKVAGFEPTMSDSLIKN